MFRNIGGIALIGLYGFGELVENSDIRTDLALKQDEERRTSAQ